jgi:hypothetical protein
MLTKKYFNIEGKRVPFISGGSYDSVGSIIDITFDGSIAFNPNTSKSTDIHFVQLALGEGPIYRVNPNGPQDIEIDGKFIDDLVDFTTNNTKPEVFSYTYNTGTSTQSPLTNFFPDIINPVRFTSPITLKSGISVSDTPALPETSVQFFSTSAYSSMTPINSIRFKFEVEDLQFTDTNGSFPAQLSIAALVHESEETLDINNYIVGKGLLINSLVTDTMMVEAELTIPESKKSDTGYNISALKVSPDIAEEGFSSEVSFIGFDEVTKESYSYPRTATIGYAVKSSDFREGNIPNYSSLIKGLIVDVPSNYNQPVLENGEVDWRYIEVPATGPFSAASNGYYLQDSGTVLLTDPDIPIYKGVWDGTYKKDWTENYAWIIKYLLTDQNNGLGLPEEAINKYSFYRAAQYFDAVDPATGYFKGVKGFADGSFRYKPLGYNTQTINNLLGLPEGTELQERRFVCGTSITDRAAVSGIINALAASCRAIITTFGSKISIVIDQESILPSAYFNETNIEANSFKISGLSERDLITSVDVSYIDFVNHFERDTVSLQSKNVNQIDKENILSIDASGCTRKSQALRLAAYHLESQKGLRRKVQFSTFADASDLEAGEVIAVSQQTVGTNYGYGGKIAANSSFNTSNAYLEHFTSPAISSDFFTGNTNPLVFKVFRLSDNKLDYYLIDNSNYVLDSTNNSTSGIDYIEVNILSKLNPSTKTFETNTTFSTSTAPVKGDLWALGEIDLGNIYATNSDKLFKVDSISIDNEGKTSIAAVEYNSNALAESDNAAVFYSKINSSTLRYTAPPPPTLDLKVTPAKTPEGVISYNVLFNSTTNTENYNIPITTSITYSYLPNVIEVYEQE